MHTKRGFNTCLICLVKKPEEIAGDDAELEKDEKTEEIPGQIPIDEYNEKQLKDALPEDEFAEFTEHEDDEPSEDDSETAPEETSDIDSENAEDKHEDEKTQMKYQKRKPL